MHVIEKGNGGQLLFESASDYRKYLLLLQKNCEETNVKICAFCLMENHVHLLTYSDSDSLLLLMRKLGISYAEYFNRKYDRTGHLFQDRYKSEPIEDERYLLTVFRYIILNPQKAGIKMAKDYTWSSYKLYNNPPKFMDMSLIRELIGDFEHYEDFIHSDNDDKCLECGSYRRSDSWAINEIKKVLGVDNCSAIMSFEKSQRDEAIITLKKMGLSVRQIERLTGISRGVIQKIK